MRSQAAPPGRGRHRRPRASLRACLLRELSSFRKREVYRSTTPDFTFDTDVSAVSHDDGAADREPEAQAACLVAHLARAEEALEEARLLVGRDARALVDDADLHESVASGGRDGHGRVLGRVTAGVRNEVREYLRRAPRVGEHAVGVGPQAFLELLVLGVEER